MSNQTPSTDSPLVRRAKAGAVAVAAVGGGVIVGSLVMGAMQQGTATADTQHVTSAVANDQQLAPPQVPDQGGLSAPQAPPQAVPVDPGTGGDYIAPQDDNPGFQNGNPGFQGEPGSQGDWGQGPSTTGS